MCMCEASTAFVCKFSSMVLIALIGRIQFKWIFIILLFSSLFAWHIGSLQVKVIFVYRFS
jgi:hypothetical protein